MKKHKRNCNINLLVPAAVCESVLIHTYYAFLQNGVPCLLTYAAFCKAVNLTAKITIRILGVR